MFYYIEAKIKDKIHKLNKVGEQTYMLSEPEMIRKTMLKGYVVNNFRDVITDLNNIQSIKYMKGKTILFSFQYP